MKTYIRPTLTVVKLQAASVICVSVREYNGNVGFEYGGAGDYAARTRESNIWEEW